MPVFDEKCPFSLLYIVKVLASELEVEDDLADASLTLFLTAFFVSLISRPYVIRDIPTKPT
jgi:hypothetical protein